MLSQQEFIRLETKDDFFGKKGPPTIDGISVMIKLHKMQPQLNPAPLCSTVNQRKWNKLSTAEAEPEGWTHVEKGLVHFLSQKEEAWTHFISFKGKITKAKAQHPGRDTVTWNPLLSKTVKTLQNLTTDCGNYLPQ